ncbi:hypothetical protein DBV15_08853 [Temnothorax longispinosus]|uniref:Uncharacterized protein n=1 Tax=Temnothorax longispinosus TaxID=300112 RepID=A0A4S2L7F1_9HYME|nr:hypothetical protein DBV15_08853 [Temnothorax longispinosus]
MLDATIRTLVDVEVRWEIRADSDDTVWDKGDDLRAYELPSCIFARSADRKTVKNYKIYTFIHGAVWASFPAQQTGSTLLIVSAQFEKIYYNRKILLDTNDPA